MLVLDIPANAWDPIDTIVVLTVAGSAMEIAPIAITPEIQATASVVYGNDPGYAASCDVDGDPDTRWATPDGTRDCSLQLDFSKPRTIGRIEIDEAYAEPASRVRKFEVQKKEGDSWVAFDAGTALGVHFKASFKPVTTRAIRLHILDASEGPTLSEVRVYAPEELHGF
jgi:hypothetical protein